MSFSPAPKSQKLILSHKVIEYPVTINMLSFLSLGYNCLG